MGIRVEQPDLLQVLAPKANQQDNKGDHDAIHGRKTLMRKRGCLLRLTPKKAVGDLETQEMEDERSPK